MRWKDAMAAVGSALLACGCGLAEFDVEKAIAEQRVPGNALSGVLDNVLGAPIPMDIDVSSETAARDTGPAKAVRLRSLSFGITDTAMASGDEDDFAFLQEVDVYVESSQEGSTLERQLVARWQATQPVRRIVFDTVYAVNLKPYAEQGARFVTETSGSVPADDVTFDGSYTLTVEVL